MKRKRDELTDAESRAIQILLAVKRAGHEPHVGNWVIRCFGLLNSAKSAIKKLGW